VQRWWEAFLTLQLLPQLGFIFLLLPLFPIFMALLSFSLNGVVGFMEARSSSVDSCGFSPG